MKPAAAYLLVGLALSAVPASAQLESEVLPDAHLPYLEQREFRSPLSGESFTTFVLKQPLPALSFDFDGCPHPPINTLAYTLVIDPESGWVDSPEGFALAGSDLVSKLCGGLPAPRFNRQTPEGLPWAGAYAWEKFENAARLAQANGADDLSVANFWLNAAWSVRLDVVSGDNHFDQEVEGLFALLPTPRTDPGDLLTPRELILARQIEELGEAGRLMSMQPAQASLARAWLYRSRGELAGVRGCLGEMMAIDASLAGEASLYDFLLSSTSLEEDYLRLAASLFERAYNSGKLGQPKSGGVAFVAGEIRRRLGQFEQARQWYAFASQYGIGAISPQLIERQLALTKGRGY